MSLKPQSSKAAPPADDKAETADTIAAGSAPGETEAPPPGEASETDRVVDAWFAGFNDTALSRNPEFWDLVRQRLPDLKAALSA